MPPTAASKGLPKQLLSPRWRPGALEQLQRDPLELPHRCISRLGARRQEQVAAPCLEVTLPQQAVTQGALEAMGLA